MQGLIEIENPNRVVRKAAEKVTKTDVSAAGSSKPDLSRREREELERQRAQANYQKLHAEGKTEQARADLARLAIIKQVRNNYDLYATPSVIDTITILFLASS